MLSVEELVDRLIDLSFAEDIGDGDHTTLCCIPDDAMGKSRLLIKEDGILAGVEIAKEVFRRFDPTMQVEVLMQDGARVKKGDVALLHTRTILHQHLHLHGGIETVEYLLGYLHTSQNTVFLDEQMTLTHRVVRNTAQGGMIAIADILGKRQVNQSVNQFFYT